jgi:hypothetical protein
MNIKDAQYLKNEDSKEPHAINCLVNETPHCIPMNPANRHYAEILKQVEAGTLTIKEAD